MGYTKPKLSSTGIEKKRRWFGDTQTPNPICWCYGKMVSREVTKDEVIYECLVCKRRISKKIGEEPNEQIHDD